MSMLHRRTRTFIYLTCALVASGVVAQGPYPDGSFIFPPNLQNDKDMTRFPTWQVGTIVTIQWNSSYQRSNLFYSQFWDDGTAQLLVANTDKQDFAWTVKPSPTYTNLSIPFHFRVVNPRGTPQDQAGGGIWSSGFFFGSDGNANSASASLSSTATSSTASSSSSSSPSSSTTQTGRPSTSSTPNPSGAAIAAPGKSSLSGGAIAGIVIGVLAGVFAALGFLLWARRRKKAREAAAAAESDKPHELNPGYDAPPHEYGKYQQQAVHYVEAPGGSAPAEVYGDPKPPLPPAELGG